MIELQNVSKVYRTAEVETYALSNVSLHIDQGEFVAIMGPSGCGKSTLLSVLGLLDTVTTGAYRLLGENVVGLSEDALTALRRASIGMVFQGFHLIDDLTVAENVEVGLMYRRGRHRQTNRKQRVDEALERVGLPHRARHLPQQLSGGQQQRVAIARALVSEPNLLLADEPTGNLDTANGDAVMQLIADAANMGITVVIVTHSTMYAARASRVISLLDGQVTKGTPMAAA